MNSFPRLRLILVLNNINSHLSKDLTTICEKARVYLEYLSLYSSNYNLIKESFSILKT